MKVVKGAIISAILMNVNSLVLIKEFLEVSSMKVPSKISLPHKDNIILIIKTTKNKNTSGLFKPTIDSSNL